MAVGRQPRPGFVDLRFRGGLTPGRALGKMDMRGVAKDEGHLAGDYGPQCDRPHHTELE